MYGVFQTTRHFSPLNQFLCLCVNIKPACILTISVRCSWISPWLPSISHPGNKEALIFLHNKCICQLRPTGRAASLRCRVIYSQPLFFVMSHGRQPCFCLLSTFTQWDRFSVLQCFFSYPCQWQSLIFTFHLLSFINLKFYKNRKTRKYKEHLSLFRHNSWPIISSIPDVQRL